MGVPQWLAFQKLNQYCRNMTTEAQKELREFWKKVNDNSIIYFKDYSELQELFAKVDGKIERRITRLEESRDNIKRKYVELRAKILQEKNGG